MHLGEINMQTKSHILPEERRQQICDILLQEGKVTVLDLASRLEISVDTIRRDLKELENSGRLTRVHGGALPRSPAANPYRVRQVQNRPIKQAIAAEAAKLIQPNQVIFVDGGTTALEVARNLPLNFEVTIVTTSPAVLVAIGHYPYVKAIMLGGTLDPVSMTIIGSDTSHAISQINADVCILGVCSLHAEIGVTASSFEESKIKGQMIKNSSEVIAVTTSEKLGTAAPFVITSIDHLTHIVTEQSAPDEKITPFIEAGIEVIKAKNTNLANLNFP